VSMSNSRIVKQPVMSLADFPAAFDELGLGPTKLGSPTAPPGPFAARHEGRTIRCLVVRQRSAVGLARPGEGLGAGPDVESRRDRWPIALS
jgi:hypothetical protein